MAVLVLCLLAAPLVGQVPLHSIVTEARQGYILERHPRIPSAEDGLFLRKLAIKNGFAGYNVSENRPSYPNLNIVFLITKMENECQTK